MRENFRLLGRCVRDLQTRTVVEVFKILEEEVSGHSEIRLHLGMTQVWNRQASFRQVSISLSRRARVVKPDAIVWRGDASFAFGTTGSEDFWAGVRAFLSLKSVKRETLFERIPQVGDTQAAWLLLLMCASPRATFWLRSVNPDLTDGFAERHDAHVWQCLQRIIGSSRSLETAKDTSSLSFLFGRLGLSSATRVRRGAHWASWAD